MVIWDPHCLRLQGLWLKLCSCALEHCLRLQGLWLKIVQLCSGALFKITRFVAETVQLCVGAAPRASGIWLNHGFLRFLLAEETFMHLERSK